ncbi:MAG TPA: HIT domain-containing protein [Rhodospirillales bacterium]|nr:HIT domain-containing protein [Rhodospirillales bacterium]
MFALHETLAADTVEVMRLPLCRALLMNDANYPWLILVPQKPGLTELHHLIPADQSTLMAEVSQASQALEAVFAPGKINVAALGNMVEQLHIHVVARFKKDPAWPGPIWGKVAAVPYGPAALAKTVESIRAALG